MNQRPTWHTAADAQTDLYEWLHTARGLAWLAENYRTASKGIPPDTTKLLATLIKSEAVKVAAAEPIFVSGEMCELVAAASDFFEPEPLIPQDLTTAFGFVYYEHPFEVPDRFDHPTTIKGFSWTPILAAPEQMDDPDVLAWMQRQDYVRNWQEYGDGHDAESDAKIDGLGLTVYAAHPQLEVAAGMIPIHFTPWWFGMDFRGNETDLEGKATAAEWWWKILQTTLRLMQQRISGHHRYRPDRPTRRRRDRLELPDHDVVVVRLRREAQPNPEPPQSEANYSHRFIVGGHWRNAWYASEGIHRQIWISPYIKGDPSLPLIIRPKRAYAWSR